MNGKIDKNNKLADCEKRECYVANDWHNQCVLKCLKFCVAWLVYSCRLVLTLVEKLFAISRRCGVPGLALWENRAYAVTWLVRTL